MENHSFEVKIEYIKNINDLYKVLITLCLSLLVLSPTLMSSVFDNPNNIILLLTATGISVFAIISSVVTIFYLTDGMQYQDNKSYWIQCLPNKKTTVTFMALSVLGFLSSIILLPLFIIFNADNIKKSTTDDNPMNLKECPLVQPTTELKEVKALDVVVKGLQEVNGPVDTDGK